MQLPSVPILTSVSPQGAKQINLTDEQQRAVDEIVKFVEDPQRHEFRLGGYAGTGKTTVIKYLLEVLRAMKVRCEVCAFTGKAVYVLNKKGVFASTIHSLMYNVIQEQDGTITFEKKYKLEGDPDLLIVDEASMVSTDLHRDMTSYGKKYLYVGDPGQLEPVGDNPRLMDRQDYTLQKIHRQAEASPIIRLATSIRLTGNIDRTIYPGELDFIGRQASVDQLFAADQVLCAKNKTRVLINNRMRANKGYPDKRVIEGEKIIVLRNNQSFGVFNGLILTVKSITQDRPDFWECSCEDEVGKKYTRLPVWKTPYTDILFDPKTARIPSRYVYTDFAYAITCHKSQGSEWEHVLVVDEWMPPTVWDMKRWRYTAITRAAKRLSYVI